MRILKNIKETPAKLLQTYKTPSFLGSAAIRCDHCQVVFPEEYGNCPNCKLKEIFQSLKNEEEL